MTPSHRPDDIAGGDAGTVNCPAGQPVTNEHYEQDEGYELIVRPGYVLVHSGEHKLPLWVAERVDRTRMAGSSLLSFAGRLWENFEPDPALSGPKATLADYSDSRFDPGHHAAAGNILNKDAKYKAMRKDTFYLSNNAPQLKDFNRGIWVRLEKKVREWAQSYGAVWVICGPAFISDSDSDAPRPPVTSIGAGNVSVPTHFWKIVSRKQPGKDLVVTSWLFPHAKSDKPLSEFVVPLETIEELAGWSFFPDVEKVEQVAMAQWGE
jgi:endonuclease G